jgi:uncharacterized protein YqgV (UPF0045/DUF77 family)
MKITERAVLNCQRREINFKITYWENQKRKAEKQLKKYQKEIKGLEKELAKVEEVTV